MWTSYCFRQIAIICVYYWLVVYFITSDFDGVYGDGGNGQRYKGPNVCGSKGRNCCSGWNMSPSRHTCTSPNCNNKCGRGGSCVAPRKCRCSNGEISNNCASSKSLTPADIRSNSSSKSLTPADIRSNREPVRRLFAGQCQKSRRICQHICLPVSRNLFRCACPQEQRLLSNSRSCGRDYNVTSTHRYATNQTQSENPRRLVSNPRQKRWTPLNLRELLLNDTHFGISQESNRNFRNKPKEKQNKKPQYYLLTKLLPKIETKSDVKSSTPKREIALNNIKKKLPVAYSGIEKKPSRFLEMFSTYKNKMKNATKYAVRTAATHHAGFQTLICRTCFDNTRSVAKNSTHLNKEVASINNLNFDKIVMNSNLEDEKKIQTHQKSIEHEPKNSKERLNFHKSPNKRKDETVNSFLNATSKEYKNTYNFVSKNETGENEKEIIHLKEGISLTNTRFVEKKHVPVKDVTDIDTHMKTEKINPAIKYIGSGVGALNNVGQGPEKYSVRKNKLDNKEAANIESLNFGGKQSFSSLNKLEKKELPIMDTIRLQNTRDGNEKVEYPMKHIVSKELNLFQNSKYNINKRNEENVGSKEIHFGQNMKNGKDINEMLSIHIPNNHESNLARKSAYRKDTKAYAHRESVTSKDDQKLQKKHYGQLDSYLQNKHQGLFQIKKDLSSIKSFREPKLQLKTQQAYEMYSKMYLKSINDNKGNDMPRSDENYSQYNTMIDNENTLNQKDNIKSENDKLINLGKVVPFISNEKLGKQFSSKTIIDLLHKPLTYENKEQAVDKHGSEINQIEDLTPFVKDRKPNSPDIYSINKSNKTSSTQILPPVKEMDPFINSFKTVSNGMFSSKGEGDAEKQSEKFDSENYTPDSPQQIQVSEISKEFTFQKRQDKSAFESKQEEKFEKKLNQSLFDRKYKTDNDQYNTRFKKTQDETISKENEKLSIERSTEKLEKEEDKSIFKNKKGETFEKEEEKIQFDKKNYKIFEKQKSKFERKDDKMFEKQKLVFERKDNIFEKDKSTFDRADDKILKKEKLIFDTNYDKTFETEKSKFQRKEDGIFDKDKSTFKKTDGGIFDKEKSAFEEKVDGILDKGNEKSIFDWEKDRLFNKEKPTFEKKAGEIFHKEKSTFEKEDEILFKGKEQSIFDRKYDKIFDKEKFTFQGKDDVIFDEVKEKSTFEGKEDGIFDKKKSTFEEKVDEKFNKEKLTLDWTGDIIFEKEKPTFEKKEDIFDKEKSTFDKKAGGIIVKGKEKSIYDWNEDGIFYKEKPTFEKKEDGIFDETKKKAFEGKEDGIFDKEKPTFDPKAGGIFYKEKSTFENGDDIFDKRRSTFEEKEDGLFDKGNEKSIFNENEDGIFYKGNPTLQGKEDRMLDEVKNKSTFEEKEHGIFYKEKPTFDPKDGGIFYNEKSTLEKGDEIFDKGKEKSIFD